MCILSLFGQEEEFLRQWRHSLLGYILLRTADAGGSVSLHVFTEQIEHCVKKCHNSCLSKRRNWLTYWVTNQPTNWWTIHTAGFIRLHFPSFLLFCSFSPFFYLSPFPFLSFTFLSVSFTFLLLIYLFLSLFLLSFFPFFIFFCRSLSFLFWLRVCFLYIAI
jgi:hypothetical protein